MSSQCTSYHKRYLKNQANFSQQKMPIIHRRLHSTNPSESYSSFDDSFISSSSESSVCFATFNSNTMDRKFYNSSCRGSTDSGLETGSTGSVSSSCGKASPTEECCSNLTKTADLDYTKYTKYCEVPSFSSDKCPLGPRPPCIGQESSPQSIRKTHNGTLSNLGRSLTCSVERSELEPEWNDSTMDASCTTCELSYSQNDLTNRSFKQNEFVNHIQSCNNCLNNSDLCSVAAVLEQELSSIFEIQDSHCCHSQRTNDPISNGHQNNGINTVISTTFWSSNTSKYSAFYGSVHSTRSFSSAASSMKETTLNSTCDRSLGVTMTSDMTDFMEKPMCKSAVNQPKISKDRKKVLKKKLKTIGRYFKKVRNGGRNKDNVFNQKNTDQFTTLAVL